jgi:Flp pilus assembly protein TadD
MNILDYSKMAVTLARQGKMAEAIECFRNAVRLSPADAFVHYNLGTAFMNSGQFALAAQSFAEAVRLNPNHASAQNNLGIALKQQGKTEQAISAYQKALSLEPNRADFVYNLGNCYSDAGDLSRAVVCYRQALQKNPNYADASNNLGKAFKELGLLSAAVILFRHTLKLQPNHACAIYNLSELVAGGDYCFTPAELEQIQAAVASANCSRLDKCQFSFTIAKVHHLEGSYDSAFAYYRQANELKKLCLEEHAPAFERRKHEALIDRIIIAYDQPFFQRIQGCGLKTERPVFIVGMPRSGSTLVEQILASHPQVFGAGEVGEVTKFHPELTDVPTTDLYSGPILPKETAAQELAANYLACMTRLSPSATRVMNKSLDNFLHLGLIATLFPQARIIHCRRDPRDLCLSCYFQNFQDVNYACSLEDIGAYYCAYEKLMAHWAKVLPLPVHEVRYEDLVHGQESVTRNLLTFCGLDWDEHCLTFFNTRRVVRTASSIQVRKPMSAQAIGRWKHYRAHLNPLFKALGWEHSPALPPQDLGCVGHDVRVW